MAIFMLEISNVLNHLISINGISEAALGRKIGVPRATINRLVSGKTPDPRASTLEAIAHFFGITIDQLLGKQPIPGLSQANKPSMKVDHWIPILAWEQAFYWQETISGIKHKTIDEWVLTDPNIDGGSFALIFKGDSMFPQFYENTILIIDTNQAPKNRDFVIAYCHDNKETLFRQLIVDGSYKFLKPINTIFPTLQIKELDQIIGLVVQSRNNLR
jgi:SOS-response transcriptional repressor LexA